MSVLKINVRKQIQDNGRPRYRYELTEFPRENVTFDQINKAESLFFKFSKTMNTQDFNAVLEKWQHKTIKGWQV